MWLCLNDAFLSVVEPKGFDLPKPVRGLKDPLMVRARNPEHLKRAFPKARIFKWKGRDYPCRVFVERAEVARVVSARITGLHYDNFKNSVADHELHDAYSSIWSVMWRYASGAFRPKPYNPAAEREFAWGRGERVADPTFGRGGRGAMAKALETVGCSAPGCTDIDPCLNCIIDAMEAEPDLGSRADDRYGDFDEAEDADAVSHLRVAPR